MVTDVAAQIAEAMAAAYADYEEGRACSPSALDLVLIADEILGGSSTPEGRDFVADVLYESPVWEQDHLARAEWLVAELTAE